jgi:alkylated DNA repair dioxygenase AlkB
MVKIIRNVGGVPGLDLASDAFSEDIKRQLFSSRVLFANAPEEASRCTERHVHATGPHHWDASVWCVSNLLGDLFPDKHVPPDYCLALNYPPGAGFNFHCDSCFRWGECVWGVSLGQEAILSFLNCGGKHTEYVKDERLNLEVKETDSGKIQVNLQLPRRSIYVMHGPARLAWKHGILKQTKNRLKQLPKPPFWNPWNLRRSLTFRTTKA